ncbi:hypothetical protein ABKN59_003560 [Abortiporus biennis]
MIKSCLKQTPPVTPNLSAYGTPCESRSGSPEARALSAARKAVSFCSDEVLEEIFEADEWDRSPAPMTPRLTYQDVLELKALRLTPPHPTPSPAYRQSMTSYFPTTTPSVQPHSSSSKPTFPISRFAMAKSHTPSKWKNREEPRSSVDPEILPYLEAVPIQLLPLLDESSTPLSEPQSQSSSTNGSSSLTVSHHSTLPPIAAPRPSTSTSPVSLTQSPRSNVSSVQLPSNHSPSARNFTFVPLLPPQEAPSIPEPVPIQKPPEAPKKFNMAFVPLLPVVSSAIVERQESEEPHSEHNYPSDTETERMSPASSEDHQYRAPSPTSTPSLSSASDTESEEPNNSNPSSPVELDTSGMLANYFASALNASTEQNEINPYFPIYADDETISSDSRPLSRPPNLHLPIPAAQNTRLGESGQTPVLTVSETLPSAALRKTKLQAIPSPSLLPPSPFSLNPPSNRGSPVDENAKNNFSVASPSVANSSGVGTMTKRAFAASRGRSSLSLSSIPSSALKAAQSQQQQRTTLTPATPELTIEYLRQSYDANRFGKPLASVPQETESELLGPSISRRMSRE